MKAFIKANGGIVMIMTTIIGSAFWITSNMAALQIEQAEKFQVQNDNFQKQILVQQEKSDAKFYSMLEKINEIDKSSLVRDKDIEILISKK
jgi:hypothetical protein